MKRYSISHTHIAMHSTFCSLQLADPLLKRSEWLPHGVANKDQTQVFHQCIGPGQWWEFRLEYMFGILLVAVTLSDKTQKHDCYSLINIYKQHTDVEYRAVDNGPNHQIYFPIPKYNWTLSPRPYLSVAGHAQQIHPLAAQTVHHTRNNSYNCRG